MTLTVPPALWNPAQQPDEPNPTPRRLITQLLRARGLDAGVPIRAAVGAGPVGAHLVVTEVPGPGMSLEGALDTALVQVRVIGPQQNADVAEAFAGMVDDNLADADPSSWEAATGVRVQGDRYGSRMSWDSVDEAQRTHFTATYLLDWARRIRP